MRPELFLVSTTNSTSVAQSRCFFCGQATFESPLTEAVRRKRGQALRWLSRQTGHAQHRRNQQAVEQADPGSVQAQVCRNPHREQEEQGQEQQEWGPCAQQRLCSLMNRASPTAGSARFSGCTFTQRFQ